MPCLHRKLASFQVREYRRFFRSLAFALPTCHWVAFWIAMRAREHAPQAKKAISSFGALNVVERVRRTQASQIV
jgi:hypothetical protein